MIPRSHCLAVFGLTLISALIVHTEVVYARPPVASDFSSPSKANQLTVSEQTIRSGWRTVITPTSRLKPRVSQCQPTNRIPSATCAEVIRRPNATPQSLPLFSTPQSQQVINLFPIDPLPGSVRFLNIASP
jgi:hypothetical protein